MFQFPPFPPHTYVFSMRYPGIPPGGFPHSDISGSKLVGSSPKLFAACYVLRRPLTPRHPPYALSSLTTCKREDYAFCSVFKVPVLRSSGPRSSRTPL